MFIKTSKTHLQAPCAISFTSGFDGRTLVSYALKHNVEFSTFSYGISGNEELVKMLWNSDKLFFLEKAKYKVEFEEMMNDISKFRKNKPTGITENQFFYFYVFTEMFRKVFGSFSRIQQQSIDVRLLF